jgi:hypothetical protein
MIDDLDIDWNADDPAMLKVAAMAQPGAEVGRIVAAGWCSRCWAVFTMRVSLRPSLPTSRMLPAMDSQNQYVVASNSEVHGVREPRQHCAPCFVVRSLIRQRILADASHESVDGLAELPAQTSPAPFIPLPDLKDFVLGFRPENNSMRHGSTE